jgi:uncharacterized membrane protein
MILHYQRRTFIIILFSIFLINLIFRWLTLTDCGIWYDEAYSVFYSQKDLHDIKMVSTWDIAPPFYNYLLHFWMSIFGISENAVRMLSVLLVSLSAVLLYWIAFRHLGTEAAVLSSVLFFVHNEVFYYAQESRTYALLAFFAVASAFCFFELLNKPRWYWIVFIGVINWAAIYSQYVFMVIPAMQLGIAVISLNKKVIFYFLSSLAITMLLFGKWLNRIHDVYVQGGNTTIKVSTHLNDLISMLYRLANGIYLFYFLLILSLVGIVFYMRKFKWKLDYNKFLKVLYLITWAFGPVIAIFISKSSGSTFIPRYLFFTVPAFCLSSGFLVNQIPFPRLLRYSIILLVITAGFLNISLKIQKGTDYKNAGAYIRSNQTDSTLVVIQTTAMGPLFSYYYDRNIFKTKDSFEIKLFQKHVILKEDSAAMHSEILNCFSKVILAQTFQQFNDPKGTLVSFLSKRFNHIETINQFTDILIREFSEPMYREVTTDAERRACNEIAYQKDYVEPKKEMYRQRILNDSGWLKAVREKAEKQNVPLDTMLNRDALFMISKE